jgi:aminoglycoside phosphotransferase (APT) family kinase protein
LEEITGGKVVSLERHVARREAWLVDIALADGRTEEGFLRIDRGAIRGAHSTRGLARETVLLKALEDTEVPSQRILGWNEELQLALQQRVRGAAELNRADRNQQHAVMIDFMDVLARLHNLDAASMELPGFEWPETPEEHSFLELRAVESSVPQSLVDCYQNPVAAFGKRWLQNHVPRQVDRTVLLQGDTGPANFMFEGDRVSAIVDWEWAHFGDPMEDLGNICARDYFHPSSQGNLGPYFKHYERVSGIPLDLDKVRYYLVHQLVRSTIGLTIVTEPYHWRMPMAMNLGYRAIIERAQCEATARAMGVTLRPTEIAELTPAAPADSLHQVLAHQLREEIAPGIDNTYLRHRTEHGALLAEHLDLVSRYAERLETLELEALRELLGGHQETLEDARRALLEKIEQIEIVDEPAVLQFLADCAYRREALAEPLVRPWSHCRWAAID